MKTNLLTLSRVKKVINKLNLTDIPVPNSKKDYSKVIESLFMELLDRPLIDEICTAITGEQKNYIEDCEVEEVLKILTDFFTGSGEMLLRLIVTKATELDTQRKSLESVMKEKANSLFQQNLRQE